MRHPSSLKEIVENGLCIGCGLCQSIAGRDRVEMVMVDPPGRLRPKIKRDLDRDTEAAILAGCPGALIDEPVEAARHGADVNVDPAFGPWRRMWRGHAADPEIHHLASSGGALTALGIFLLETKKVDFILHVTASKEKPMRTERHLSFDRAQVIEGAGSRYGPAAPLTDFTDLLNRGQPFAVIGKPCDISAVHNMRKVDARVDELVRYTLAFSCGTFADLQCSRWMLERQGVPGGEENLALFRYRGYGCPGPTRAVTKDGQVFDEPYLEFWYGPHGWTHQFRCKICPDPTGETTDISISDAWPGGGPTEEEWGGTSLFISRTMKGDALMDEAIAAGAIAVEPSRIEALYECQPHQVVKKSGIKARLQAIEESGMAGPVFRNVRLDEAAALYDADFHIRNHAGTRERIQKGVSRESLP